MSAIPEDMKVPRWAWNAGLWGVRLIAVATAGAAWSTFLDVRDLVSWRHETLPLTNEAQAKQLQLQISATEQRALSNSEKINMLQTEFVMLEVQIARLEERNNRDRNNR